jgi:hypothetical protein
MVSWETAIKRKLASEIGSVVAETADLGLQASGI